MKERTPQEIEAIIMSLESHKRVGEHTNLNLPLKEIEERITYWKALLQELSKDTKIS